MYIEKDLQTEGFSNDPEREKVYIFISAPTPDSFILNEKMPMFGGWA